MQTVAWREIRSAARRPATYWTRAAAAGIGGAVLLLMMMQAGFGFVSGRTLFQTCVWLAFLICLLEGVRQASTSIVEERVEGTLGLLLLTRIRGAELLLGKFAALGFFALQTLLAVGPIVAMSLIIGGVSGWEVARATLALANTLVVALTVGVLISARSRDPSRAMFGTFFILAGVAFMLLMPRWPVIGWPGFIFNSLNPFTPMRMFDDFSYGRFTKEFWLSLLSTLTIACLTLWFVSRKISAYFAIEEAAAKTPEQIERPEAGYAPAEPAEKIGRARAKWFSGNPIEWLCLRHLRLLDNQILPIAIAIGIALLMCLTDFYGFMIGFGTFLIFGFLYSAGAAITFARARQSGELELWLTTPLGIDTIIRGQLSAMRKAFAWPGLIVLIGACIMIWLRMVVPFIGQVYTPLVTAPGGPAPAPVTIPLWPYFYLIGSTLLSMTSLIFALPYVAMWIALKSKSPARATILTFLLMFIAPWVILGIPKVLIFVPVGLVASHSVRKLLKNYAARSFSPQLA
jgi:hypothetical protein